MRNGLMLTSVAGALSMILSGAAMAANHVPPTGGWNVVGGDFKSVKPDFCNGGSYDCSIIAEGKGFMQLSVSAKGGATVPTLGAGESFIQTIVTDQGATGAAGALGFQDVSFVKMSLNLGGAVSKNENGIFGQQKISEGKVAGAAGGASEKFTSDTTIARGWGLESAGSPSIQISQAIDNQGGNAAIQGDDFISGFNYKSTTDEAGVRTGLLMDISQIAGLQGSNGSTGDVQAFALRERAGTFNAAAGTVALPATGGKTVPWVANDDVKAIWVGQSINLGTDLTQTGGSALGSSFGYLSFENVSKAAAAPDKLASQFGFGGSNAQDAWVWSPTFGAKPTLLAP